MSKKQKEIYDPIGKINEEIYKNLHNEIPENEWTEALKKTKPKLAPGVSGISYLLIKKVGSIAQEVFRYLANLCLQSGEILAKQELSKLYPISKRDNQDYSLDNVHLIILLETFRKAVVRVLTHRLNKVLTKYSILEGPNFAGLTGNSTAVPIHILNNILEDARQKGNELWILFQDMHNAFDSVSLKILKNVLTRIKLSDIIINFILSLYEKQKIKVVTSFGLTSEFEAENRIDQGEVIFPLVQ